MTEAQDKPQLWAELKEAGWKPPANKSYVNYKADELQSILMEVNTQRVIAADPDMQAVMAAHQPPVPEHLDEPLQSEPFSATQPFSDLGVKLTDPSTLVENTEPGGWELPPVPASGPESARPSPVSTRPAPEPEPVTEGQAEDLRGLARVQADEAAGWPGVPRSDTPDTIAGLRLYTHGPDEPVRVDRQGKAWFSDEVQKTSTPRRARRILHIKAASAKTIETRNELGFLEESFEVAGDEVHDMQVKITLPPAQVGVYKDPSHPFRIHTYGGQYGYKRLDVVEYYGGMLHVPSSCQFVYVGGDLCYSIDSVRDTIETEFRERVLRIERPFS